MEMPRYRCIPVFRQSAIYILIFKITEVDGFDDVFGPARGLWVFPIPTSRFRACSTAKGIVVHRVGRTNAQAPADAARSQ